MNDTKNTKTNNKRQQQQQQQQPAIKKCDRVALRSEQKQISKNNNCCITIRRKIKKKHNKITTKAKTPATTINSIKCNYDFCNNKLLIALLLLITMTAMTTTTTTTAAAAAAAASASSTTTTTTSAMKSETAALTAKATTSTSAAAAETLLSPTQRRQQPQQQLFALLTRNRQTSGYHRQLQQQQQYFDANSAHLGDADADADVDDDADEDSKNMNTSGGYIADDGRRYEKALQQQVLAAADDSAAATALVVNAANGGVPNCPKECKCLNDFFDCGRRHLERVPELPTYVQIIDLVGNRLNDSTVLQITNLSELAKLSLKRNQLQTIPKFVGLPSLKQLNLANNRIQHIASDALMAMPKLKALDLSRNLLHSIEANYFPQSNRLAHLILSNNNIESIHEHAFETLTELIELDLSSNRLSSLPAGVFKNQTKLKKLSLNYNRIEINWSTFKGLITLQKLLLKANNIRLLQDGVFHVMRAIEIIELDHNSISGLNRQGLFNLTKLHYLSLSNNSISRIELDTWEFTQSLVTLDLSHNNISEFKPQHLDCLQRLRHLNLGHNKINFLYENTFDCVKNLEDLNLRRNKLAWIIEDPNATPPFRGLRKLKKLDLYGNNLKQINSKSLNGLASLETLNLGGNSLASIQSGAFEHMPHLQKVKFKSLNFICDCELLWFRRWLQHPQAAQLSSNAVCGYPEYLLDREVLTLTPAELVCADTPKPVITKEPSNQLAVKGANITLECIAMSPAAASLAAADELKIKWRHDNQHIRERATEAETQIHHNQETNQTIIIGYLRLYNVSYENSGRYQCVVANAFGTTYSQKFKMSIGIRPSFLQIPSNLTIDSGDSARLVCSATGDPMPEIALQKFGASDFPAATERRLKVLREENAFIITNAKPIDTGIYTCTAESAAGEIKINATLLVNDKPQPAIPLVRKEIVLGQTAVLECLNSVDEDESQTAAAQRRREWFKDNKPFHTSATSAAERHYFTAAKELLIIVNVQPMDGGHYRCDINDAAKMYTIQTELIVVPTEAEDHFFTQNRVIVGVALVTAASVMLGIACCVWLLLGVRGRKPRFGSSSLSAQLHLHGGIGSAHTLNSSRAGALEQTQMTTLNRSYLQQHQQQQLSLPLPLHQHPQHHHHHHQYQYHHPQQRNSLAMLAPQRPSSVGSAELVDDEQRNSLIAVVAAAAAVNADDDDDDSCTPMQRYDAITLDYLARGDDLLLEQNLDHLSSKDSGTGSDAAAKRSIDDFTLSLLPADEAQQQQQQLQHNDNAVISETSSHNDDAASECCLELNALSVRDYECVNGGGGDNSDGITRQIATQKSARNGSGGIGGKSDSDSDCNHDATERQIWDNKSMHAAAVAAAAGNGNICTNFYNVGHRQCAAVDI